MASECCKYIFTWLVHISIKLISSKEQGDLWYFPPGYPHSIQALNTSVDGAEFLLVFDDGSFNEDNTFLLTDWLAHVPKEVIAKNFGTPISAFDHIPSEELYIFPCEIFNFLLYLEI